MGCWLSAGGFSALEAMGCMPGQELWHSRAWRDFWWQDVPRFTLPAATANVLWFYFVCKFEVFYFPKLFINLHLAWKKPAVLPAVLPRLPASISRSTEFSESSSSKPATRSYKEDRAWKKMVLSETTWNNRVIFCVALPRCQEETPARRDFLHRMKLLHTGAPAHGSVSTQMAPPQTR